LQIRQEGKLHRARRGGGHAQAPDGQKRRQAAHGEAPKLLRKSLVHFPLHRVPPGADGLAAGVDFKGGAEVSDAALPCRRLASLLSRTECRRYSSGLYNDSPYGQRQNPCSMNYSLPCDINATIE